MSHPIFNKLKFLKSSAFWGYLLVIACVGGYVGYVYWISQLKDKELRAEHREWAIGLLFPVVVGVGGYLLNQQAEKRSDKEKNEEREQFELKDYFDRISTLVIDKSLIKCDEKDEQYQIARALTANILRELTQERMNQVMFFLDSLNLSGKPIQTKETNSEGENEPPRRSVSLLKGIDLSNANLRYLNGGSIDLSEAYLDGADLNRSYLDGADLSAAYLNGAELVYADLNGTKLIRGKLIKAKLIEADLTGAELGYVNLSKANLFGANLTGANLVKANLTEAYLAEANLFGADLNEANLTGANLFRAKLEQTKLSEHLTEEQQKQCAVYEPIIVEIEE